jgi:FlaA1/EpsC-like NDP-sugar epimerase
MDIRIKVRYGQSFVRSMQHNQFAVNKMIDSETFNHAFEGRHVFLTGGTGMLGTALLVKMTKDTSVSAIHVLVRGGEGKSTYSICRTHTD